MKTSHLSSHLTNTSKPENHPVLPALLNSIPYSTITPHKHLHSHFQSFPHSFRHAFNFRRLGNCNKHTQLQERFSIWPSKFSPNLTSMQHMLQDFRINNNLRRSAPYKTIPSHHQTPTWFHLPGHSTQWRNYHWTRVDKIRGPPSSRGPGAPEFQSLPER